MSVNIYLSSQIVRYLLDSLSFSLAYKNLLKNVVAAFEKALHAVGKCKPILICQKPYSPTCQLHNYFVMICVTLLMHVLGPN